jgi:hypothetical protein
LPTVIPAAGRVNAGTACCETGGCEAVAFAGLDLSEARAERLA